MWLVFAKLFEITSINYWRSAEDGGKLHENVREKKARELEKWFLDVASQ